MSESALEKPMAIVKEEFAAGTGHALAFNVKKLREHFDYIGLWYGRDKNEETYITTELYYGSGEAAERPDTFNEEIKENSFQAVRRFDIPLKYDRVWAAARNDNGKYCGMKIFTSEEENLYINYKVIQNKSTTYDTLSTGMIKGGPVRFFKLGIEDRTGTIDFDDTIMYVVLIKEMPPADWGLDSSSIAVQRLPVMASTFTFSVLNTYSTWLGQNPMDGVK